MTICIPAEARNRNIDNFDMRLQRKAVTGDEPRATTGVWKYQVECQTF